MYSSYGSYGRYAMNTGTASVTLLLSLALFPEDEFGLARAIGTDIAIQPTEQHAGLRCRTPTERAMLLGLFCFVGHVLI